MISTTETHAMVLADTTGRICYWSVGAERLFGYRAIDAIGQTLDLIVPEAYRERHWAGFENAMATVERRPDLAPQNMPVRTRDGTVLAFPVRFVVLTDAHERIVGTLAIYAPRTGNEQPFSVSDSVQPITGV